jgi:hypothetical protein
MNRRKFLASIAAAATWPLSTRLARADEVIE